MRFLVTNKAMLVPSATSDGAPSALWSLSGCQPEEVAEIGAPTLVIHGVRDRNVPFGAGREWAAELGEARLLSLEETAHFSWIENRRQVLGAIEAFLEGEWPEDAEIINRADPLKDPEEDA